MPEPRRLLFTAFEPSGDAIAAKLIAELRRRAPGVRIDALGGPLMEAAGAELIESTTGKAVMFADALGQALDHHRRVRRLRRWLASNPVDAAVPTDSPAANWAVCSAVRRARPGAPVVHLVAPQLWAWASWRIRRMRRLSDHALCMLPFEPAWFESRGVGATFVGHPLFDPAEPEGPPADGAGRPVVSAAAEAHEVLALLPGSRRSEVLANWPTMLGVWRALADGWPGLRGVVAASDSARAREVDELTPGGLGSAGLSVEVGRTPEVLDRARAALVVSGTATLLTASRRVPMVVLFNLPWWKWEFVGRWLVRTRTFSLPNLVAEGLGLGRPVPEFVPHCGDPAPLVEALEPLLSGGGAHARQVGALAAIGGVFQSVGFRETAADTLLRIIERATRR